LNQNTDRQPSELASAPPTIGPATCAEAAIVTFMPSPTGRMRAGNASVSSAVVFVMIAAAPTACSARSAASAVALGASPHSRLAPVRTASPTW
jgi:hypothetical protein